VVIKAIDDDHVYGLTWGPILREQKVYKRLYQRQDVLESLRLEKKVTIPKIM
jgi:hypothetical protein